MIVPLFRVISVRQGNHWRVVPKKWLINRLATDAQQACIMLRAVGYLFSAKQSIARIQICFLSWSATRITQHAEAHWP